MNALFTAKGRYTNLSAEFGGATKRAPVRMDKNIYKFIFKHTKGQQADLNHDVNPEKLQ